MLDSSTLQTLASTVDIGLKAVDQRLSQPMDYIALKTLYAAPKRIFDGMIVKADGTTWNPGSGAGIYAMVGASWVKL